MSSFFFGWKYDILCRLIEGTDVSMLMIMCVESCTVVLPFVRADGQEVLFECDVVSVDDEKLRQRTNVL
jgi:hypothetical protein